MGIGMDAGKVPLEDRTIELPLEEAIEIGRSQQVGFFEQLLQREPSWLSFVSRSHCRVTLRRVPLALRVENLSANVVFVGDRRLCKDTSDVIDEDGLEFRLRRLRSHGASG